MGRLWGLLGPSSVPLGLSWGLLGGLMGRLGTILGAPWAVLDAVESKKATMLNTYVFREEFGDVCFLGPWTRSSGSTLGPYWGPRGPSRTILDRRGATFGRVDALLDYLGALFGPFWAVLELFGGSGGPRRGVGELVGRPLPLKRHFGPQGRGKGGGGQPNVSHAFSPPASGGRRIYL